MARHNWARIQEQLKASPGVWHHVAEFVQYSAGTKLRRAGFEIHMQRQATSGLYRMFAAYRPTKPFEEV